MVIDDTLVGVMSLIVGSVSIALAGVAMFYSWYSARESRANLDEAKETLSQINAKAAVIENVVSTNQQELQRTVNDLLKGTLLPEKPDTEQMLMSAILPTLLQQPRGLENLIELGERMQQREEK